MGWNCKCVGKKLAKVMCTITKGYFVGSLQTLLPSLTCGLPHVYGLLAILRIIKYVSVCNVYNHYFNKAKYTL